MRTIRERKETKSAVMTFIYINVQCRQTVRDQEKKRQILAKGQKSQKAKHLLSF